MGFAGLGGSAQGARSGVPVLGRGADAGRRVGARSGAGAYALERLEELSSPARGPGPDAPHPADRELLTVLDGRLAGKSWRETAVDLYGAKRVAANWNADSWMRSRVRRRGKKARSLMEGGYRDLVAGR